MLVGNFQHGRPSRRPLRVLRRRSYCPARRSQQNRSVATSASADNQPSFDEALCAAAAPRCSSVCRPACLQFATTDRSSAPPSVSTASRTDCDSADSTASFASSSSESSRRSASASSLVSSLSNSFAACHRQQPWSLMAYSALLLCVLGEIRKQLLHLPSGMKQSTHHRSFWAVHRIGNLFVR